MAPKNFVVCTESTNSSQTTVRGPKHTPHVYVLFLPDVVYCYSHTVLMQVLSQQAIRATHNKTSTHSSTLRPPLLIQPTVD